jgi:hypothetical protein
MPGGTDLTLPAGLQVGWPAGHGQVTTAVSPRWQTAAAAMAAATLAPSAVTSALAFSSCSSQWASGRSTACHYTKQTYRFVLTLPKRTGRYQQPRQL